MMQTLMIANWAKSSLVENPKIDAAKSVPKIDDVQSKSGQTDADRKSRK